MAGVGVGGCGPGSSEKTHALVGERHVCERAAHSSRPGPALGAAAALEIDLNEPQRGAATAQDGQNQGRSRETRG